MSDFDRIKKSGHEYLQIGRRIGRRSPAPSIWGVTEPHSRR
ncbi:unnamed protein product [Ciceribacter selenitireducens ATCC BAA-1503]|uniref:Uncharacterized protein n=1 Tax=Ciceribacter selenitireducens ATCC BAA-1503 TaxID=1336235 RepID=A0A376A9N8_9HYPH|nr:unnamed protein product [Ciceribacter selenitireducens ATCC BAA-1503]